MIEFKYYKAKVGEKMNPYVATHIYNAQAMARNFEQSCNQAAKQDDGSVSKEEEKLLKKSTQLQSDSLMI